MEVVGVVLLQSMEMLGIMHTSVSWCGHCNFAFTKSTVGTFRGKPKPQMLGYSFIGYRSLTGQKYLCLVIPVASINCGLTI